MNGAPDYELMPFVETCLILQSVFLNLLWIVLLLGWVSSLEKFPRQTLQGGTPGRMHWAAAFFSGGITLSAAVYFFEPIYWFLGLAFAGGAFLSTLNPAFSICFMMSMILMRPWEIMPNNDFMTEVPRFSMFFSLTWAALYTAAVDRFKIRFNKILLILFAYSVWVLLSTAVTPNPTEAVAGFNETIVRAVVLFLLVYVLIRDEFSVWALKTSLVTILTCVGLIAVVFYFQGYTDGGRVIAFGIFKNTNDIAAVMTLLLPLSVTPFFRKQSGLLEKALALIPITISLMVLGLAQSRGAVTSLGMAVCIYAFRRIKRKTLAIAAIAIILVAAYLATTVFQRAAGDLEGSSSSRKSFLISGIRMAIYNPVFGVGYGQFPNNYETYATEISHEFGKRTAHSSWVLALAESGPIGLLLYLSLFGLGAIAAGYRIADKDPSWLFAAASYGTSMSFLSHTYMLFPYILIAAITVAARTDTVETALLRQEI